MSKRILLSGLAAVMLMGTPALAQDDAAISPDALVQCSGLYEALSEWATTRDAFETYFHFGGGFKNAAYQAAPGIERADDSRVQLAINAKRNAVLADIKEGTDPIVAYQGEHETCSVFAMALGLTAPQQDEEEASEVELSR
ncbi:MAG: hypothetical protein ACRBCL_07710 [Maritimibacter sp.]